MHKRDQLQLDDQGGEARSLTSNGSLKFAGSDVLHLADRASSFVVDHVTLVLEVSLDEFVHASLNTRDAVDQAKVSLGSRPRSRGR